MHWPMPLRHFIPVLCLALLGCIPADPLDWKVSAKTPNHYHEWRDTDFRRLSPEVRGEFDRTFNWFATLTPGGAKTDKLDQENALTRRLHGRTIRSVVLEGYQLETTALLSRISNTTDNMLRSLQLGERSGSAFSAQRLDQNREAQTAAIEKMNARLAEIKARVQQLERRAK